MAIIVDALDAVGAPLVITSGSAFSLDYILTRDGATYNLTGKTVVCTIRDQGAPQTVVNAVFEDRVITVGGGTTTAANGGCFNAVNATDSALLGPAGSPTRVDEVSWYIVQTKVSTDNYKSTQVLRFGIRKDID